jgi:hypothetical protein
MLIPKILLLMLLLLYICNRYADWLDKKIPEILKPSSSSPGDSISTVPVISAKKDYSSRIQSALIFGSLVMVVMFFVYYWMTYGRG